MNNDTELTIGQRLKKARMSHDPKLNQYEVAKRAGLTQPSISELERGTTRGTPKVAELAAATNVNMIWLATGRGEMRGPEVENRTELLRLSYAIQRLGLTRSQVEEVVDQAIAHASKIGFTE